MPDTRRSSDPQMRQGVVEAAVASGPNVSLPITQEGQSNDWNGCQGV